MTVEIFRVGEGQQKRITSDMDRGQFKEESQIWKSKDKNKYNTPWAERGTSGEPNSPVGPAEARWMEQTEAEERCKEKAVKTFQILQLHTHHVPKPKEETYHLIF